MIMDTTSKWRTRAEQKKEPRKPNHSKARIIHHRNVCGSHSFLLASFYYCCYHFYLSYFFIFSEMQVIGQRRLPCSCERVRICALNHSFGGGGGSGGGLLLWLCVRMTRKKTKSVVHLNIVCKKMNFCRLHWFIQSACHYRKRIFTLHVQPVCVCVVYVHSRSQTLARTHKQTRFSTFICFNLELNIQFRLFMHARAHIIISNSNNNKDKQQKKHTHTNFLSRALWCLLPI